LWANAARAATQNPVDTPQWQAAVHSHYGYCDADVLRQHWQTDIDDAKIRLGGMILNPATPKPKKGKERVLGQGELLLPIAGRKEQPETETKPATQPTSRRKSG
jgi:hypothetical protein